MRKWKNKIKSSGQKGKDKACEKIPDSERCMENIQNRQFNREHNFIGNLNGMVLATEYFYIDF